MFAQRRLETTNIASGINESTQENEISESIPIMDDIMLETTETTTTATSTTTTATTTSVTDESVGKETFDSISFMDQNEYESINNYPLEYEYEKVEDEDLDVLQGNRIVDLKYVLQWAIDLQVQHSKTCTVGKLKIKEENRLNLGLVSCITFKCNYCDVEIKKYTENPNVKSPYKLRSCLGDIINWQYFQPFKGTARNDEYTSYAI
ncbi:unnamed protein product [Callosobruchus maculatus]|uniref:Uncharacterized protein n=1 Tax=Callosobruchus maculatus TaxID=64391 RepID=A0A653CBP5_CALMS|nr:unnamed protein product [Callosobruchus maculatus]